MSIEARRYNMTIRLCANHPNGRDVCRNQALPSVPYCADHSPIPPTWPAAATAITQPSPTGNPYPDPLSPYYLPEPKAPPPPGNSYSDPPHTYYSSGLSVSPSHPQPAPRSRGKVSVARRIGLVLVVVIVLIGVFFFRVLSNAGAVNRLQTFCEELGPANKMNQPDYTTAMNSLAIQGTGKGINATQLRHNVEAKAGAQGITRCEVATRDNRLVIVFHFSDGSQEVHHYILFNDGGFCDPWGHCVNGSRENTWRISMDGWTSQF